MIDIQNLEGCAFMLNMEIQGSNVTIQLPKLLTVREEKPSYIQHDLLFKRLIETFFSEFIEAFFPELYHEIDFSSMKHLSEEMVPSIYDGNKKALDIVVEVKWKKTDTIIVVHVEPQSYQQADFNKRMFHYFSLLYRKVDKPVLPIAVFSYDEAWEKDKFKLTIGHLNVLTFNYLALHLGKMNWRQFVQKENPVSAALLSKMGYNKRERIKVKIEFFRILTKLKIDLEKRDILIDFFQTYLQLSEREEEILMEEVNKLEDAERILEITNPYVERGKRIGRAEGHAEGRAELQKEVAVEMLKEGSSIEFVAKITKLDQAEIKRLKKELSM